MAKRKKAKERTFPKPQGDGGPDRFVPEDRPDQIRPDPGDRPEIIDVFATSEEVEVRSGDDGADKGGADGGDGGGREDDDRGVRMDSAVEGDARGAAREDDDDRGSRRRHAARGRRGEDDDDDDSEYSRRVRRRINRERVLRERSEKELAEERAARQRTDERLAKIERAQREGASTADIKTLEAEIARLQKDLDAAVEEDDTKLVLKLTTELGDKKADLRLAKVKAEQAAARAGDEEQRRESTDRNGRESDEGDGLKDFLESNAHWWSRKRFADETDHAVVIDKRILREIKDGRVDFEPYSEEHLEELALRLKKHYPDLEVCDVDGEPIELPDDDDDDGEGADMRSSNRGRGDRRDDRRNGRDTGRNGGRAPVSNGGGRTNGRRQQSEVELARQGKVHLTEDDYTEMRKFNLDPSNPEHKKRFARERMRTIVSTGHGVRES